MLTGRLFQLGRTLVAVGLGWGPGLAAAPPESLRLEGPQDEIRRFEVAEWRLEGVPEVADPYDPAQVEVTVEFSTAGRHWQVPAFWMQDYERRPMEGRDWFYPRGWPGWRARFAAPQTGEFTAGAMVRIGLDMHRSAPVAFRVVEGANPGFLQVSRRDPRWLEWSSGRPFFAIGQNLAFIGPEQYFTLRRAEAAFGRLAEHGANYVRVWTCCGDWALALEAPRSAWSRSWQGRAPVEPMPDTPGRRCVGLTQPLTPVSPSHPVALRPDTRYEVTGRLRVTAGAEVRLEVSGTVSSNLAPAAPESWADFRHEFRTGPDTHWLGGMRLRLAGPGRAWLADLSLTEAGGGPELLEEANVNRPERGWYHQLDAFWLDELLRAAQRAGVYLQLCLLQRDLYMGALMDPTAPAYDRALADARKVFRYAVARWGAFTSLAAWEYWNEMDPGLPTDRFYAELGQFLEATDPWRHLRTTSTWAPSPRDCQHPKLDLADVHYYYRPADHARLLDEVEGILDRARWLRAQAPAKPALQGEGGLADDQWRITDEMRRSRSLADFHNMLWASALSGTSGTALAWWWERLDERDHYRHYRPLSRFLADVPWTGGELRPFTDETAGGAVRVVGLQTSEAAWVWCFHRAAAWRRQVTEGRPPGTVREARVRLRGLRPGTYRVQWWDPQTGNIREGGTLALTGEEGHLPTPEFAWDLALKVRR